METLPDKVLRKAREWQFLRGIEDVLETPPITPRDDGLVLFSMIGTRVVLPYIVALKSLHLQVGRGRVVILDDGTLTASDKEALAHHCGRPEIVAIDDVDTGRAPRGSCWERLFTLLEMRRDNYVIQLDTDTVTLGAVPEVADAIAAGRDFTLRGEAKAEVVSASDAALHHVSIDPHAATTHVQAASEIMMDRLTRVLPQPARYVRGCAGFAGFAPGGSGSEVAEAFSIEAEKLLGKESWARWGSEQVMSNVLIANAPDPVLLPYARYVNFWNEPVAPDTRFVHFIGTYRYHRGAYLAAARRAIASLSPARAAA